MAETKKRGSSTGHLVMSEPKEIEKPKPTVHLSEDEMPEIKDHVPGKRYKIAMEVEMRSHSKGDKWGYDEKGKKKKHEGDYIVHSAKEHDCPEE